MKHAIFFLAILALVAFRPIFASATDNERPATTQMTSQEKEQFEHTMEERLRKLGRQLDEIKARAAAKTEEARKDMNRYLADAEKRQETAKLKLEKIRKESAEKWKKFVSDMNKAADDFEKAYERAKSHFKE